jgi:rfaE bifunctional protein kinase chain/domain
VKTKPERSRLLEIVDGFDKVKVLAFVDLVADEYIYGEIANVSREAPVLILKYDRTRMVPGGGANAVNNIAALGGRPLTVGIVGKDAAGRELLRLLRQAGIKISHIERLPTYRTPTKTRILAGGVHSSKQQVVRIDRATQVPKEEGVHSYLSRSMAELLPKAHVVMVSDYGYGLVTPEFGRSLARRAASMRKMAVLDSRFDLLSYSGFASATPNEPEVEAGLKVAIGNDVARLERSGRQLLRRLRCPSVLVTRGSKGMALFESRRPTRHIPVFGTDEVADVTGAGDTVISTFSLALGAGASFYEAALLANYAGGIVVMKRGTATVARDELAAAVAQDLKD